MLWFVWAPLTIMVMVLYFPLRGIFRFSMDEGLALMAGMLMERGHPLYSQIWNDQPPLFFHLMAGLFPIFGFDVGGYRLVILVLSATLLWAAFQFLSMVWGKWIGVIGVILLLLLPKYLVLSLSVMAGLPAVTLAMLSLLALTRWHSCSKRVWLVVSALLLALSVLTKLFTGFLAPVFLIGILIAGYSRSKDSHSWMTILIPPFIWGAVFAGAALLLTLSLVGIEHTPQLILNHLTAREVEAFQPLSLTISFHLRAVLPQMLLAIIGTGYSVYVRRWLTLYLSAWMVAAYVLLAGHAPVWDHQQVLVTIPAAMLAAIATGEGIGYLYRVVKQGDSIHLEKERTPGLLAVAAAVGIILLVFTFRAPAALQLLSPLPSLSHNGLNLDEDQEQVLSIMRDYAPQTELVVSDQLMFPFRTRLPVPPKLAFFTSKRVETGELTEEEIIQTISRETPEQVLLSRFPYPAVNAYLERDYEQMYARGNLKLYVRKDLVG